ncbi:MAG TPA: serine/threonine-protein kinase [Polyangiaceae bacterium]|nr:serine/threonine-protein kinase [Polyangiaceae bacterium]
MAIHPGDTLAGYRVTQLLGRGGMGEVWAAVSPDGRTEVAIKVLLPNAAIKPELVARFEREAQVTASIDSEFVCRLLATERDKSGAHLLVFEKLTGESLSERLQRELYLPFAEVGPIVADALQGLDAAHRIGVIHRDLKPGNIFLEWTNDPDRPERAKILDFGISKLTRREGKRDEPSLTDFDATLGSFAYMAPEQVRGAARVDQRADVYAMGAVAFRALAGRLPFEGTNAGMIIALKLDRPAPSLSEVTGDQWPAGLERFLACALQREPEVRFATAGQALAAWREIMPMSVARRSSPPPLRRPAPQGQGYPTDTSVDEQPTMTEVQGQAHWDGAYTETDGNKPE